MGLDQIPSICIMGSTFISVFEENASVFEKPFFICQTLRREIDQKPYSVCYTRIICKSSDCETKPRISDIRYELSRRGDSYTLFSIPKGLENSMLSFVSFHFSVRV